MGEIDIALRHLATQYGPTLAATYVEEEVEVEVEGWSDSQVTWAERRLDKALKLKLKGRLHLLHFEFQLAWKDEVPYRIFEYQATLTRAHVEAGHADPPAIRSVVVLLTGLHEGRPAVERYGIGWPDDAFSGATFIVDRIARLTVRDLLQRPSPFWLAFSPLTTDASPTTLVPVLERLQRDIDDVHRLADIVATMEVLAQHDPRQFGLGDVIQHVFPRELIMQSSIYQQGLEQGREQGLKQGLEALSHLYHRRLGRPLNEQERQTLRQRLDTHGPDRLGDVLFELDADALAQWLHDPEAT